MTITTINPTKASYLNGICPDCNASIPDDVQDGESCVGCSHVFSEEREDDDAHDDSEPHESYDMSDDSDALASAGFGTDEDYGCYGGEEF